MGLFGRGLFRNPPRRRLVGQFHRTNQASVKSIIQGMGAETVRAIQVKRAMSRRIQTHREQRESFLKEAVGDSPASAMTARPVQAPRPGVTVESRVASFGRNPATRQKLAAPSFLEESKNLTMAPSNKRFGGRLRHARRVSRTSRFRSPAFFGGRATSVSRY